jgi:hypothetical protein
MTNEPDIAACLLIDEFAHDGTGQDDQYLIELYKTEGNRHFVSIVDSGYNSIFSGAFGFYCWVPEENVDDWVTYAQNI